MNPETFTLENLFAMELHNFSETISEIVGSANKELSIEKSLAEVVSIWQSLKFSVHKYDDRINKSILNCNTVLHYQVHEGYTGAWTHPRGSG